MVQKTISLTPEVFEKLRRMKNPRESYSDLVTRLLEKETNPMKLKISGFFGTLVESEDGEWDKILENIYLDRAKPRSKDMRLEG
ncbi:MAG TPA: antitoxin VapB family protein [Candidatus Lokiarchaeia archaeon]|nr:antitoxin VapB family protein [Candidatus Lokiarchaeia archaeon]